jgi:hypothetical protein
MPDLQRDIAPTTPDVGPADLSGGDDERQLGGVPKGFRIDNHTDSTIYVSGTAPVTCAPNDPSRSEDCSFFTSGCGASCTNMNTSQSCCTLCLTPAPSLYAIAPGKSQVVPWSGMLHTKVACAECSCDGESPVPSNVPFRASISVYPAYACTSEDCFPSDTGLIVPAAPAGSPTTYTVVFAVPYLGDQVVFDIGPRLVLDAATPDIANGREVAADVPVTVDALPDLEAATDNGDGPRPVPAGVPQDGSSAVFAGIPGETFVIGSETPPEDASVASGIACSPPSMPAHCTVLFSASGAEKEISRTDSVQELICLGMLTVATSQVPSDRNWNWHPHPFMLARCLSGLSANCSPWYAVFGWLSSADS